MYVKAYERIFISFIKGTYTGSPYKIVQNCIRNMLEMLEFHAKLITERRNHRCRMQEKTLIQILISCWTGQKNNKNLLTGIQVLGFIQVSNFLRKMNTLKNLTRKFFPLMWRVTFFGMKFLNTKYYAAGTKYRQ